MEAPSVPEEGALKADLDGPGCACQPPVLASKRPPHPDGPAAGTFFALNGRLLSFTTQETLGGALWALVEREGAGCEEPTWDTFLLKHGFMRIMLAQDFAIADRTLYFTANDEVHGFELWKTDGTTEGTMLVKDIIPGEGDSVPRDFFLLDETLYFTANDGMHGRELWKSDGTARGTRLVEDIRPGPTGSEPFGMVKVGEQSILFTADDGSHGREPWRSDGTRSGTRLIEDIHPGPTGSEPTSLNVMASHIILFTADDGEHGRELWKSDGTPGGTRLVEDIRPGPEGSNHFEYLSARFTVVGPRLYFSADDGVHGHELWRSDGTPSGTRLVEDIRPGSEGSMPSVLKQLDGWLFFSADDGTHGREPWRSDGTAGGTLLLVDAFPGTGSSSPSGFPAPGKVFFYATSPNFGQELWVTDGSRSGTRLVKDIRPGPASAFPRYPSDPIPMNGGLIFSAFTDEHGDEPWLSDGTREGTRMMELFPGPASSTPFEFTRVGEWVYFTAEDGVHDWEVWALPMACFPKTGGR
ncbi:ELWxxDGT repeat protein [Archangium violaceum]|uniref:ELWxxDGT repeat protein n=1 Tax=Archangium violaceum TaxID=83451 RepID=UPI0036DBCE4F